SRRRRCDEVAERYSALSTFNYPSLIPLLVVVQDCSSMCHRRTRTPLTRPSATLSPQAGRGATHTSVESCCPSPRWRGEGARSADEGRETQRFNFDGALELLCHPERAQRVEGPPGMCEGVPFAPLRVGRDEAIAFARGSLDSLRSLGMTPAATSRLR